MSASFGQQVVSSSLKAVALALLLILIYVTFRFQWKFAIGAIAAEIHDLLIVVGVYSLTGREVTTATIAAVLTILGYSLYDTVIIYDRIRENEPRFNRIPYGDMVNLSIWETLTRSINTSLITLLPVVCLLLFGGGTLQGLRLRAARRHPLRRLLVDLRREPDPHAPQGARAAVQEAQGRGSRRPGLTLAAAASLSRPSSGGSDCLDAWSRVGRASFRFAESLTRQPPEPPTGTLYIGTPADLASLARPARGVLVSIAQPGRMPCMRRRRCLAVRRERREHSVAIQQREARRQGEAACGGRR